MKREQENGISCLIEGLCCAIIKPDSLYRLEGPDAVYFHCVSVPFCLGRINYGTGKKLRPGWRKPRAAVADVATPTD